MSESMDPASDAPPEAAKQGDADELFSSDIDDAVERISPAGNEGVEKEHSQEKDEQDDKEEAKEEPAPKKRYKLKVDEEELEVDEDELQRAYERKQASFKRFEEAAKLKKELEGKERKVEAFLRNINENPEETLMRAMGPERLTQLAENIVWKAIQKEKSLEGVPDHVRQQLQEAEELKRWRAEQEAREQEQKQSEEERKQREAIETAKAEMSKKIVDGLKQFAPHLPKTPETIRRAAFHVQRFHAQGIPFNMQDVVEQVEESYRQEFQSVVKHTPPEALEKLYGKEFLDSVRKYDLSRLKRPQQSQEVQQSPSQPRRNRKRQPLDWDAFE